MAAALGRDVLPGRWSFGVCADGRVFFIDDDMRTTTWLHPRSGEPVNSGHMIRSDLPCGWEEGFTDEGANFFINHNQRTTAFLHPVSGRISAENVAFALREQPQGVVPMMSKPAGELMSSTTVSDASPALTSSTVDSASKGSRCVGKVHSFGKREQAIQRNLNFPVVVRGWLYKQDSSGMRLWRRKWFVLADYCLFYYKDSREESLLGSIPLPSYLVSAVEPKDHISRKFAFKASYTGMRSCVYKQSSVIGSQAEHSGMRTYYFSADTQEDMNTWLRSMKQAALMQSQRDSVRTPSHQLEKLDVLQQHAVPQTDHLLSNKLKNLESDTTRPIIHQVFLEPIRCDADECCCLHKESPAPTLEQPSAALEMDTHASLPSNPTPRAFSPSDQVSASAPVSTVPSRAPSRAASTLPSSVCTRNGLVSTPSPILEPNGIAAGTYQRIQVLPPADAHKQVQRRNALEQVEQWVQVQRTEHKSPPSRENTLPQRTPASQHKLRSADTYQTLPKTLCQSPTSARLGEYKYAQDRLSHFRLTPEHAGGKRCSPVWQLYEWQQRHQFRHGSPTAPLYNPAPEYPFGPAPPSTVPPSAARFEGHPRCVSVPPSSEDGPPPGPLLGTSRTLSPSRRPHTPAERLTVQPDGDRSMLDILSAMSPRRTKSQLLRAATLERRPMPSSGYMSHTVSAPSLHGKTADDTYLQLKRDLEYLDLKVAGSQMLRDDGNPVKVAESDVDVTLSRLCEQDKILKDLETRISSLKEDKDKLENVLDLSHQQMEQYEQQSSHAQKMAYQQRLLQEDLVTIRAQISRLSTEMALAWDKYGCLDRSVEQLRAALQAHMSHSNTPQQDRSEMKRELWRIEDVMAGLSARKANYQITIESVQNPERKLVPSVSDLAVPSLSDVPVWAEDAAPPRPPLPQLYEHEETPPVVPPLPKEASVIRHTSVRGLKRQSDERKRDRESGQFVVNGDSMSDLRSYQSEPELLPTSLHGASPDTGSQSLQSRDSSFGQNQSNSISSYITLRRGPASSASKERPKSSLELSSSPSQAQQLPSTQPRGRMTAEEQLERMKRHQRALVSERKRNLSQGERSSAGLSASKVNSQRSSSSTRLKSSTSNPLAPVSDWPEEGQSEGGRRSPSDEWLTAPNTREMDVEPLDYEADISLELSKPLKVPIPERYIDSDPEEPPSPQEQEQRVHRTERIRNLLARSSVQNIQPTALLDSAELHAALKQQEKIINVSRALASEASRKSKLVAAKAAVEH